MAFGAWIALYYWSFLAILMMASGRGLTLTAMCGEAGSPWDIQC
jgi:hypothetical protein